MKNVRLRVSRTASDFKKRVAQLPGGEVIHRPRPVRVNPDSPSPGLLPRVRWMTSPPKSKAAHVREHMSAGRWAEAVRLAASFPRLDRHRQAILDARTAYTNPR